MSPQVVPTFFACAAHLGNTAAEPAKAAPAVAIPTAFSARCIAAGARRQAMRRGRFDQLGQGMTEYIIVVALIAVAAIGVYTLFGQTLRNQTAGLALEVSGQTASAAITNAQTNATTASTNANQRKGLDNYDANNR